MSTRPTKQDADRCRRLAREAGDERTRRILLDLADEHDAMMRAQDGEQADQPHPSSLPGAADNNHVN
jgi:rRNA pseudouridine-1189 N-methylase Emg1 (Nep1/Mra1 family)